MSLFYLKRAFCTVLCLKLGEQDNVVSFLLIMEISSGASAGVDVLKKVLDVVMGIFMVLLDRISGFYWEYHKVQGPG